MKQIYDQITGLPLMLMTTSLTTMKTRDMLSNEHDNLLLKDSYFLNLVQDIAFGKARLAFAKEKIQLLKPDMSHVQSFFSFSPLGQPEQGNDQSSPHLGDVHWDLFL